MAIVANLTADQGSDFVASFQVIGPDGLPCDLTGYSVRGQIRQTYQWGVSWYTKGTIWDIIIRIIGYYN